ncbi:MAG: SUMF1/EgtB/PvdO family nonheme iron enzyme [Salinivirgaceae bacterium]|nr:SUMF1/EgtB/PvdO family nonheme iron enzyme [Salinivirgaceae bacterium]
MTKTFFFISSFLIIGLTSFTKKYDFNLVPVASNVYMDQTEVKNVDWREYLYYQQKVYGKNSQEYKNALPDTTIWRHKLAYNEPLVEFYFRHPAYGEYPVVGISYQQAVAFCNWRSDRVNELLWVKENKKTLEEIKDKSTIPEVFKFRLPTKEEWLKYANFQTTARVLKKIKKKHSGDYKLTNNELIYGNFLRINNDSTVIDGSDITSPVMSYYPNSYKLYNMYGNVAEMISEKGIAIGGYYAEKLEDFYPDKEYKYEKPSSFIGFRCIAEKKD